MAARNNNGTPGQRRRRWQLPDDSDDERTHQLKRRSGERNKSRPSPFAAKSRMLTRFPEQVVSPAPVTSSATDERNRESDATEDAEQIELSRDLDVFDLQTFLPRRNPFGPFSNAEHSFTGRRVSLASHGDEEDEERSHKDPSRSEDDLQSNTSHPGTTNVAPEPSHASAKSVSESVIEAKKPAGEQKSTEIIDLTSDSGGDTVPRATTTTRLRGDRKSKDGKGRPRTARGVWTPTPHRFPLYDPQHMRAMYD